MTISLVTGGAGFIGSHLVDGIVKYGTNVRILDNFSTGNMGNINQKWIGKEVELIEGDITKQPTVELAMHDIDYVYHQAAQTSVVDSINNPKKTHEVNITGTKLLLDAAVKNNVKKVVLASSANVYGNDPGLPKQETMLVRPNSPYGESKLMNEILARRYYEDNGLKTVCLRYFNVYGERQNPNSPYSGVISKFIKSMVEGKRPTIYGDGKQTRDFVYVADVVEANLLASKNKNADGSVFNIATGKETTINELVNAIADCLGSRIKPGYGSERIGDIRRSYADITKAKRLLEFNPKWNLEKGLLHMLTSMGLKTSQ